MTSSSRQIGDQVVGKKGLRGFTSPDGSVEELVWVQCARLLLTLEPEQLDDLQQCLCKILNNLLSHPGDEKYSVLKPSNAYLEKHLLCHAGGAEVLLAVGFQWAMLTNPDGSQSKVLRLPVAYAQNPQPFAEQARTCLSWLAHTATTCADLYTAKLSAWSEDLDHMPLPKLPAEAVVQLEGPGISAKGGFLLQDTLRDIQQMAASYFLPHMRNSIVLRLPGASTDLMSNQDLTLLEMDLFPRVRILVSTRDDTAEQQAIIQARAKALASQALQKEIKVINKSALAEQRRKLQEDKQRTLQLFKEDHSSKEDRFKPDRPEPEEKQLVVHTIHDLTGEQEDEDAGLRHRKKK